MLSRKSPHNVRNGPRSGSVSPLSTQPKGDCSIAEPSGHACLLSRYDIATYRLSKGLRPSSTVPGVPDVPTIPEKKGHE